MIVSVSKSPDRRLTPYIKRAVLFYSEILIPSERIRNNIHITIKFDKDLDFYGTAGIMGHNTLKKAREFEIELHPGIQARGIFSTLAHEMVHVKQYAFGELDEHLSVWKGKKVNSDKIDYWWQPWEIEAHGLENALLAKFATKEKLWEVFDDIRDPDGPIEYCPIAWKSKIIM